MMEDSPTRNFSIYRMLTGDKDRLDKETRC